MAGSVTRPLASNASRTLAIEIAFGTTSAPTWPHTLRKCSTALTAPMRPAATPSRATGLPWSADGNPMFSIAALINAQQHAVLRRRAAGEIEAKSAAIKSRDVEANAAQLVVDDSEGLARETRRLAGSDNRDDGWHVADVTESLVRYQKNGRVNYC